MPLSGSRGAKTVTAGINRVVIFLVCALLAGVAPVRLAAEPLFERTDLFLQGHPVSDTSPGDDEQRNASGGLRCTNTPLR